VDTVASALSRVVFKSQQWIESKYSWKSEQYLPFLHDWLKRFALASHEVNLGDMDRKKHYLSYLYYLFENHLWQSRVWISDWLGIYSGKLLDLFFELEYEFRGVVQYEVEDIEEIFDEENLLCYPKLYAPFIDGGVLNIYPQEEYDTDVQKINAGLVRRIDKADKLFTSNKKIISFVNSMLKNAVDEYDNFDEDKLSDNEEIIAGEIETEIILPNKNTILYPYVEIYDNIWNYFSEQSALHKCKICDKFSEDYLKNLAKVILRQSFEKIKAEHNYDTIILDELTEHSYALLEKILDWMELDYCSEDVCDGCDAGCKTEYHATCDKCGNSFCGNCITTTVDGSLHKSVNSICRKCADESGDYAEYSFKMDELHGTVEEQSLGSRLGDRDIYDTRKWNEKQDED
jgi:hypothetical protein